MSPFSGRIALAQPTSALVRVERGDEIGTMTVVDTWREPFDCLWRAEEALIEAILADLRVLRQEVAERADLSSVSGEVEPTQQDSSPKTVADATPSMLDEPNDPSEVRTRSESYASFVDEVNREAADSEGSFRAPYTIEAEDDDGLESSLIAYGDIGAATSVDTIRIATLKAVDEETGDCFTYEIVDAAGRPLDHPLFELAGHELRVKPGADADESTATDGRLHLLVTDAAGNGRIMDYDLASGELVDGRRAGP